MLIKKAQRERILKGIRITNIEILSHLLFVVDLILFGVGVFSKFQGLKNILELFYTSIGMEVNKEKYLVLINGIQEEVASHLQSCLSFPQNHLDEGIKYMGFVLKPNDYLFKDWLWLF
jgi:hypothetical protein